MTTPTKFPGREVELAGTAYVMPTLDAGFLEDHEDDVRRCLKLPGIPLGEDARAFVTCVHAALARNYPEIAREEVAKAIDLRNVSELLDALLDVAGLVQRAKAAGVEVPTGEAVAPSTSTSPSSSGT